MENEKETSKQKKTLSSKLKEVKIKKLSYK